MASGSNDKLICLASVAGAHGIRGALKLRCFTEDPENVASYGAVRSEDGSVELTLKVMGHWKLGVVVQAKEVTTRNQAEALKGVDLFVHRHQLPQADEDEYYFEDLIGLDALQDGKFLGVVMRVDDFGASAVIEIEAEDGQTLALPFTQAHVLDVDLEARRIAVAVPEEAAS